MGNAIADSLLSRLVRDVTDSNKHVRKKQIKYIGAFLFSESEVVCIALMMKKAS